MKAAAPVVPAPPRPPLTLLERGLDLVFPPTCVGCRKIGRWICDGCWPHVPGLEPTHCAVCGRAWIGMLCLHCMEQPSSLESITAVAAFEEAARDAVHALKFHGHHAIASMMGQLMAGRAPAGATVVVPVPLHRSRRRERGYDQSVMLAERVARALDLPCYAKALRRTRPTKQQALLAHDARLENMRGAFAAQAPVQGEGILLVDDVTTTGATLEAAAEPLKLDGAECVMGLSFAWAR